MSVKYLQCRRIPVFYNLGEIDISMVGHRVTNTAVCTGTFTLGLGAFYLCRPLSYAPPNSATISNP